MYGDNHFAINKCITSIHCTPLTYTMLYVKYISIKLEVSTPDDNYIMTSSLGIYGFLLLMTKPLLSVSVLILFVA